MEGRIRWLGAAFLWIALASIAVGFAVTEPDFEMDEVADNLQVPTDFAFFPEGQTGRILVMEKLGQVFLVIDGVKQDKVFLDLRSRTNSVSDRGGLGIMVDRDYDLGQRFIYVAYAYEDDPTNVDGPKSGRVSRFTVSDDETEAIIGSEKVLIGSVVRAGCNGYDLTNDVVCLDTAHHALGALEMDANRHIYATTGDGASVSNPGANGMRCQNIDSNNGKIFRVDRNGNGISTNPFYNGDKTANRSKVWALGMRQPFRIRLDHLNPNCMWAADVGKTTYEEVSYICKKDNGGWPCLEGNFQHFSFNSEQVCKDMFNEVPAGGGSAYEGKVKDPTWEYGRDLGSAITGGFRMKGNKSGAQWPPQYRNAVFVMDYVASWIRYFHVNSNGKRVDGPFVFATNLKGPVQIREGPDGCQWILSLVTAKLVRICYRPDNSVPTVANVEPPNNLVNVERSTNIVVTASKRLNPSSTPGSIQVTKEANGADVPGIISYDETTNKIEFDPSNQLDAHTWYMVKVSGIKDFDGRTMAENFTSRFKTGGGYTTFLSDLNLLSQKNGHPTKSVQIDRASFGFPISHDGVIHRKGFGVYPFSRICVRVPPSCTYLLGEVSVDDFSRNLDGGRLIFKIFQEGEEKWDSSNVIGRPIRRRDTEEVMHQVAVTPGSKICLDCINGGWDSLIQNVGSWASTRFRCGTFDAVPPVVTNMVPAAGATVPLTTAVVITFNEPMLSQSLINAVRLAKDSDGSTVGWSLEMNSELTVLTMRFGELEYGSKYCVTVATSAQDLVGNNMGSPFNRCFKTAAEPLDGVTINVMNELNPIKLSGNSNMNGFPRTIQPGLKTLRKGISMRSSAWALYDLSSMAGLGCNQFKANIGVDAVIRAGDTGKCIFQVTKQNINNKLFARTMSPQQRFAKITVNLPTINKFRLRVLPGPDGVLRDFCDWGEARLICNAGQVIFLSDLDWAQKSGNIKKDIGVNGELMTLRSYQNTYNKGMVMRPWAKVKFNIPRSGCSLVRMDVGIDDNFSNGKMDMRLRAAGHSQCYMAPFSSGLGPRKMTCDVTDSSQMVLLAGDGFDGVKSGDNTLVGNVELECGQQIRKPKCDVLGLPAKFKIGDRLNFSARATKYTGANLPASKVDWQITLVHCKPSCHSHPDRKIEGSKTGTFLAPDHGDYFRIDVTCKVADGVNGTSETTVSVLPKTVDITVNTNPQGQQVEVDSTSGISPLTTVVVVGASFPVTAIENGTGGNTFKKWNHNGALGNQFNVNNVGSAKTFTAVYE